MVPEIRIMAPSLERGLDEVPVQPSSTGAKYQTLVEVTPGPRRERYTMQ